MVKLALLFFWLYPGQVNSVKLLYPENVSGGVQSIITRQVTPATIMEHTGAHEMFIE